MCNIIGIDFGTTNSVVSIFKDGKPIIIPNSEGRRITPSVVSFTKDGQRLVGQLAKRQAVSNPEITFSAIKKYLGKNYKFFVDDKIYTPTEIAAMILQKLKADAEAYLGETVKQAVITVPVNFTSKQRRTIKEAATIAGLEVLRIMNDSTAAALAYGLDKENDETILIFDFGGKNCDVSIVEVDENNFDVNAVNGNENLGGNNFDEEIASWMIDKFYGENKIYLSDDETVRQRLIEAAEKAKIELSSMTSTNINLPFITADAGGPKHLDLTLTRAKFDDLTQRFVWQAREVILTAVRDAWLSVEDIDKIILVGGSSRIPAVQNMIREIFDKEPFKGINPDECVSIGAAIQGSVLSHKFGKDKMPLLLDVTPLSLGIETLNGICTKIIERNTTIPMQESQVFSTAADGQTEVEIHVLQGENKFAEENETLGRFVLNDIPPAPRGVLQIEVTFDIDSNGIVNVSAKNKNTGKEQKFIIR